MELLGHMVTMFNLLRNCKLVSKMAVLLYMPTSTVWGFSLVCILACVIFDLKVILTGNQFVLFLERDGTTDVTRTMHFGTPTAYEKVRRRPKP